MDAHISEMYEAYSNFTNALATVVSEFSLSGGRETEATKAAMADFINQRGIFLTTCDHADDFAQYVIKHLEEMRITHQTKPIDPSATIMRKVPVEFVLSPTIQSEPRMAYSVFGKRMYIDWEKELVSDAHGGVGANVKAESFESASGTNMI